MRIELNGSFLEVKEGLSVSGLLQQLSLMNKRVAVEVNLEIISRSDYEKSLLSEGDSVEVVHAIGGG